MRAVLPILLALGLVACSPPAADPTPKPKPELAPIPDAPQKAAGERALSVIASAERYVNSIACAAHLSFALDRAKTGRPLKGLADVNALTSALASATSRANEQGQARNRSSQETGKAIAAASATALQVYQGQQEYVTGHATGCLAP